MILREKELKEKLLEGVNIIGDVVGSTLGPKGKLVLIDDNGFPYITKDGVTIAKAMNHEDPIINSAIELIKQVADKTVRDAGDATTSSVLLAQALVNYALKYCDTQEEDINMVDFLKGFDEAVEDAVKRIKKIARPIETIEDAVNVARISANGDESISSLIGQALDAVGLKGNIHVVKNSSGKTYLEVTNGFRFAKGIQQYQLLDKSGKSILEDVYIVIYNGDLMHFNPVQEALQNIYEEKPCANVLLLAHTFGGNVLDNCILNRNQNILNIYPIEAPSFGVNRNNILEDICILISEHDDLPSTIIEPIIGHANKVIITRDSTTIFNGLGDHRVFERIDKIEDHIKECDDIFELQVLKERASNLRQNVATLYIGGLTDSDINERADRIEDAVCAVKSAVEEGIVPGGGTTYLRVADYVINKGEENRGYGFGRACISAALAAPIVELASNSGYTGEIRFAEMKDGYGVNFVNNEIVNMWDSGIIDSAKACRVAFENAAAVARVFINIDSFVKTI